MNVSKSVVAASLFATVAISFWGISFVSAKAVIDKLDPFTLLVSRFGIGATFLLILILIKREYSLRLPIRYIPHVIVLSIIGVFVHQLLQASALLTIDASSAGWLITFSPVFTVFLSMIFLHEKMTFSKGFGIIIAICGVFLITATGTGKSFSFSFHIGYMLMILSTLNWAVYSVLLKKLNVPLPALVLTFYISFIGFILTLPFLMKQRGWEKFESLAYAEWGHLIFLGIFVSGVGYWYWGKALEVLEASKVSVFIYLEPIFTVIAAVILLHEKIKITSVTGGLIIIIGVILVNGHFRRRLV
ncbi:DMT family transporter [Sutcliffiella cohnii]|uniref:Multidrug transporter n=1 Tax=Sutcliffiella cohnii TaxID=33932 RepID=A0A223KMQ5_9BACI|nr:DMT family transporter [Sutcliffiella cohnii]AST90785.1 multidrug transporter [Sutcliffiella cohnii]MED4017929.1 DMT family transporter [Sutcliffiella cohnii]